MTVQKQDFQNGFFKSDSEKVGDFMYGWQPPKEGSRIYLMTDNTKMTDFELHIRAKDRGRVFVSDGESRINLGMHLYRGCLYTSNYAGICRIKSQDGETLCDDEGHELLLKVEPRFHVRITSLLNDIREDDEFDRYLAPQTVSSRWQDRDVAAEDQNEIFYFFENEKPLKAADGISEENSIITVTVFLSMLKSLCKKPFMGRMLKKEMNLTGKVKGKIVVGKNVRCNTMRGRNDRFYCCYLRYTDNILENQILKAALKKAKRFIAHYFGGVYAENNNHYASMIAYCSNALRHIDDIRCAGAQCRKLKFTGCYAYYKPVIAMAEMVLDDISIESSGQVCTSGYMIPYAVSMEKLFEVYVRACLKRYGVKSYREKGTSGIWMAKFDEKTEVLTEDDSLKNPGKYIAGTVKPDIVLTDPETGRIAVFDVKYKDYRGNSRNDRLQLLAYSMMMNAEHIGLIFPSEDKDVIFDARKVNTLENRTVMYHQILMGMKMDNETAAGYIMKNI